MTVFIPQGRRVNRICSHAECVFQRQVRRKGGQPFPQGADAFLGRDLAPTVNDAGVLAAVVQLQPRLDRVCYFVGRMVGDEMDGCWLRGGGALCRPRAKKPHSPMGCRHTASMRPPMEPGEWMAVGNQVVRVRTEKVGPGPRLGRVAGPAAHCPRPSLSPLTCKALHAGRHVVDAGIGRPIPRAGGRHCGGSRAVTRRPLFFFFTRRSRCVGGPPSQHTRLVLPEKKAQWPGSQADWGSIRLDSCYASVRVRKGGKRAPPLRPPTSPTERVQVRDSRSHHQPFV